MLTTTSRSASQRATAAARAASPSGVRTYPTTTVMGLRSGGGGLARQRYRPEGRILGVTDDATPRRFEGANVPEPEFAGDDGSPDPALDDRARGVRRRGGPVAGTSLAALCGARLMTPLVAVLDEAEVDGAGRQVEKSSHLATVSLVVPDGRRGPARLRVASRHGDVGPRRPRCPGVGGARRRRCARGGRRRRAARPGRPGQPRDRRPCSRGAVPWRGGASCRADPGAVRAARAAALTVPDVLEARAVPPEDVGETGPDLARARPTDAGRRPRARGCRRRPRRGGRPGCGGRLPGRRGRRSPARQRVSDATSEMSGCLGASRVSRDAGPARSGIMCA